MKKLLILFLLLPRFLSAQILVNSSMQEPPSLYPSTFSIAGMSSNAGIQGAAIGYNLTWYQMPDTITITAPTGFVVSTDSSTWAGSKTYTPGVPAGAVRLYVAMASTNTNGAYSGSLTHTGSGFISKSIAVSGNTSSTASLSVSGGPLTLTTTAGVASSPGTLTATFANLSGNVNMTCATCPVPLEFSANGGSSYQSSESFNTGSPLSLLVRVTSAASAGTIVDTVQFSTTGASSIKIPVGGTVSAGGAFASVVIQAAEVAGSQTNFPMVVSGTYTQLKGTAYGGTVTSRNNITFSTDAGGTSLVPWEIVKWDSTSGNSIFWVQVPNISSSGNTTIYMHYGNLGYSSFQGGSYGSVWGTNAYGIWHMEETLNGATLQTVYDWGPNGHNLGSRGSWTTGQQVTGQVGGALECLNASGNYFGFAAHTFSGDFTASGWFKVPSFSFTQPVAFGDTTSGTNTGWTSGNNYQFYIDYPTNFTLTDPGSTTANTWTYLTVTRISGALTIYRNGASVVTGSSTASFILQAINNDGDEGVSSVNTIYDEPQLWTIGETSNWVTTSYNNQSSPSTFYIISF